MTQHDMMYEQYGKQFPLTAEDEAGLKRAGEELEKLRGAPGMTPRGDGFVNEKGEFTLDPVIAEHITIATRLAESQLRELPVMPEDSEVAVRFPEIDPAGFFSVIDMKFAQRLAAVEAAAQSRTPEAGEYGWGVLYDVLDPYGESRKAMLRAAEKHRVLTRGSKLCHSAEGRQILHQRAKELETCAAVADYDKLLQSAEYAAGLRTGPVPEEVRSIYRRTQGKDLDLDMIAKGEIAAPPKEYFFVKFENLDNKLLHQVQSEPGNWGKTERELRTAADAMSEDDILAVLPPYARASVDRVIEPAFTAQEKATGGAISRADLIIIDGKTVREKMFEDYRASSGELDKFEDFFQKNVRKATNEYVAAGVMAGKRIEAFVPDKLGRIPAEPAQVLTAADGYQPSPLKPERFNAWQRFFSRYGFYKEKVARQAEYERMTAARERVRLTNTAHQWKLAGGQQAERNELFFGPWLRENGGKLGFDSPFGTDSSALNTLAVCRMLYGGYSLEEIYDPHVLRDVKERTGQEVCQCLKSGNMERVGELLVNGLIHLRDDIDQRTAGLNMADETQMLSADQRFTALACTLAADIRKRSAQECCKEECYAAAGDHLERVGEAGSGEAYFDSLREKVNTVSCYFEVAREAMAGRAEMAGGLVLPHEAKSHVLDQMRYELAKAAFGDPKDGAAKEETCSRFPWRNELYEPFAVATLRKEYDDFIGRAKDPEVCRAIGQEFVRGRFQQRVQVTGRGPYDYAVEVAPPAEKGDVETRPARELDTARSSPGRQAAAKQQKPPQMGGPRM